jgi:SLT domain-containing protein
MAKLREGGLTDSEIYDQQLDAAEKSNQWLASIDTAMRELVAGGGDASNIDAKSLSRQMAGSMNMEVTDVQKETLKSGSMKDRMAVMQDIATKNSDNMKSSMKEALKNIGIDVSLAAGGIVNEPVIAQVGEAGPEAVIPLDRLKGIMSTIGGGDNTQSGGGGGGGVLRVEGELNVKGDGSESAKLNIKNLLDSISSGDLQKLNSLLQNATIG